MISGNFQVIDPKDAAGLADAWKDPEIPRRQFEIANQSLNAYHPPFEGNLAFDSVVNYLRILKVPRPIQLLDVGAASGYYREIFSLAKIPVDYKGVDFSKAFVEFGRKKYPEIQLDVGDICDLKFDDNSFEVVLSSAALMHVFEWEKAIAELARVAKSYVILARTAISQAATVFYKKIAYDVECLQIHLSEDDLLDVFRKVDLNIKGSVLLAVDTDLRYLLKTYLLEKRSV